MARKKFSGSKPDFLREIRILKTLRSSLTEHRRIASYIAIVTWGEEYNILFPRADMDLEHFLTCQPPQVPDHLSVPDMLREATNVAGALAFLHGGIQLPQVQTYRQGELWCCHMDLKPDNILVFFPGSNSPVGDWKISDFGISVMTRPESLPASTETVRVRPIRRECVYQPPETNDNNNQPTYGRESDVWSFACILVRILARALQGLAGLIQLDERMRAVIGGRFYQESPPLLNPHVETWIGNLPGEISTQYEVSEPAAPGDCRELLLEMFRLDPSSRPTSRDVYRRLALISGSLSPISRASEHESIEVPQQIAAPVQTQEGQSIEDLLRCISEGDVTQLRDRLSSVDPRELSEDVRPLIHAVQAPNDEALRVLLRHGRDLNLNGHDVTGDTALVKAARTGKTAAIEMLLDAGATIDEPGAGGMTPLMHAALKGDPSAVDSLLERGADPLAVCNDGNNSLHYAVMGIGTENDKVIRSIGRRKPEAVNAANPKDGCSPLLFAVRRSSDNSDWQRKFRALLQHGANINQPDGRGNTPLSVALSQGLWERARDLLEKGAQPRLRDNERGNIRRTAPYDILKRLAI